MQAAFLYLICQFVLELRSGWLYRFVKSKTSALRFFCRLLCTPNYGRFVLEGAEKRGWNQQTSPQPDFDNTMRATNRDWRMLQRMVVDGSNKAM